LKRNRAVAVLGLNGVGRQAELQLAPFGADDGGDLDGDGDTDQADVGILLSSWGVDADGGLDGDGDTDQVDLATAVSRLTSYARSPDPARRLSRFV